MQAATRWAADEGARVINLSLGGPRDPKDRPRDTFSQPEADAVAYAYQKGAVLVAAVGNGDESPSTPWPYASYLTALRPTCQPQGYSECGTDDYRRPEGTSFSTPQVAAAAALLISLDPALHPDQTAALIEHSADDVNASDGCPFCPLLRDAYTGWGRLDVAK